ncbi:MAG TPA: hypothetical protein VHM31_15510, partial [Polyangia bacterium]|nr:hypothetical protein [Polyangia bacterium]
MAAETAVAALLCLGPAPSAGRLLAAVVAHALATGSFAAWLDARAGQLGFQRNGRQGWLLFATVAALLPLLGPLLLAQLLARLARRDDLPDAVLAGTPLMPVTFAAAPAPEAAPALGMGSLEARLRFSPDAASRVAAVLATRRLHDAGDAVRLLRVALRDRTEEVRLLAHALLEDRDRRAYGGIESLTRELAEAPADRRASLACLLAEASLELCTTGLVSGELESFTLRQARQWIEEARGAGPVRGSAAAALLHGRLLLRQGDAA